MLNRYHLPIGFVDCDKGCLALLVVCNARKAVGQPCSAIKGQQFATHKKGLGDGDSAESHRVGVEFKCISDSLSGIVQRILDAGVVQDVVNGRTYHIAVQAEIGKFVGDGLVDIALNIGSHRVDFVPLLFAQKVDLFLHPGICTVGTHFWEHLP